MSCVYIFKLNNVPKMALLIIYVTVESLLSKKTVYVIGKSSLVH